MAVNRGKEFEECIRKSFLKVSDVSVDRLPDQMNGYKGGNNICDFIVYSYPYQYYIECKSVHGNTLSIYSNDEKRRYGNISNKQWEGLLEKSFVYGVVAGIICWWVDRGVTLFIDIRALETMRCSGYKSIRYDDDKWTNLIFPLKGTKKRVFYDYDMKDFLKTIERIKR